MERGLFRIKVSIHAPREGSDNVKEGSNIDISCFNPRSP